MAIVARRLWLDLDTGNISESLGERGHVSKLTFKRNDTSNVGFQLHRGGVPELPQGSSTAVIGVKAKNDFGGSFLASASGLTLATTTNSESFVDTDFTYGSLSFNTAAIDAVMDDASPVYEAIGEIEIDVGGTGAKFSSRTVTIEIQNDIVRGDEGANVNGNPIPASEQLIRWLSHGATAEISSQTGGTSVDLDSITTTTLPIGVCVAWEDADSGGVLRFYRLDSGTDAESAPTIIRPDDYATTTNERVWRLLDPAISAGGGALLADGSVAGAAIQELAGLNLTDASIITLSTGSGAATQGYHTIAAETGVADDLTDLTGGAQGDILVLKADTGDTITIKHNTGSNQFALTSGADLAISGNDTAVFIFNGTLWAEIGNAAADTTSVETLTKPLTIENPTASEDTSFFYTPIAITVTELVIVVRGTTPSCTVDIRHHTDRSNAGNALITSPSATTSTTTGSVISSFNDATIPANSFVWVEMDAVSGTVDECFISIEYTED